MRTRIGRALMLVLAPSVCGSRLQAQKPDGDTVTTAVLSTPWAAFALGSLRTTATTDSAYKQLWARAWASYDVPPKRPAVDFTRDDVIVVALGKLWTGGSAISIRDVRQTAYARVVRVVVRFAEPGCIVTTGASAPSAFIRTAKTDRPTVFEDEIRIEHCK